MSFMQRIQRRVSLWAKKWFRRSSTGDQRGSGDHGYGEMMPDASMMFVGVGDFVAIGKEFLAYFIELGGLEPDHRVLDVGCGIGRMALPLTGYLSDRGCYRGFDIVPHGIAWCQERITPHYPNFEFALSDVANQHYNPKGKTPAHAYRFPYADETFDFAFLTSVFTHMLPEAMDRYLTELSRVTKPGGTVFATFFLINDESQDLLEKGQSTQPFRDTQRGYWTTKQRDPEAAIAYQESAIRERLSHHGLVIEEPIHYGFWCSRPESLSYQDIVIARRMPLP